MAAFFTASIVSESFSSSPGSVAPVNRCFVCDDGTPATKRSSTDRFPRDGLTVTTDAYNWHATGRWMVREIHIAKPGQTLAANRAPGAGVAYGDDLIDRLISNLAAQQIL